MGSDGIKLTIHLRLTPSSRTVWSYISTPPHILVEQWLIKHGNNFTSIVPKDISNSRTRRFITSNTKVATEFDTELHPPSFTHFLYDLALSYCLPWPGIEARFFGRPARSPVPVALGYRITPCLADRYHLSTHENIFVLDGRHRLLFHEVIIGKTMQSNTTIWLWKQRLLLQKCYM